jgi:hypothetical protein
MNSIIKKYKKLIQNESKYGQSIFTKLIKILQKYLSIVENVLIQKIIIQMIAMSCGPCTPWLLWRKTCHPCLLEFF